MTSTVLHGHGFSVEVGPQAASMRVVSDGRVLLRTVAAASLPGIGMRVDGAWREAAAPLAASGDGQAASAFLPCGPDALRLSVRGNRLTLATDDRAAERLGFVFALDGEWFGQGTFFEQRWPLSGVSASLDPFETTDGGCNVQCPAWFTSGGLALSVGGHPELACALNEPVPGTLVLHARDRASLDLWVAAGPDARGAASALLERIGSPARRPPRALFERPIWTTWAEYKRAIDQDIVLAYARRVVDEGFPRSVLEIDDIWQRAYGDLAFDESRFPDPKALVEELHAMGFAVTCWVPWFVDEDARLFAEGEAEGHFFVAPDTGEVELVPWWCNLERGGGLLNLLRGETVEWWTRKLRELCDEVGLDGYKFDAGEASWLPSRLRGAGANANVLSDRWASLARLFPFAEARTGWFAQRAGIPMRQWDKFSSWGVDNGLAAVVPQALSMSVVGYPFVLPDMVGGNEYGNSCSAELMVRWAQASALLPIAQFSVAPWRWGEETTERVRRTTAWRLAHANLLDELADGAVRDGSPIVRPVLWLAPTDERALRCGDEFLLGDDLLVAPVAEEGAASRDVYLPPGRWVDRRSGDVLTGPRVLEAWPAPLDVLPCFGREGTALDAPLDG